MMPINLSYIATLNIQGSDYCCIINGTSNLMPNADFMKQNIIKHKKFIFIYRNV